MGSPALQPGHYADRARTYDLTRGASPTVVRVLARHLGTADRRTILDVAGGTGNYGRVLQARGFRVFAVDLAVEMLVQAAGKLGSSRCVAGEAGALPIRSRSVDCAVMVSALHAFSDPAAALGEARRVLREGPLVLVDHTSENVPPFVQEYFGSRGLLEDRPADDDLARQLLEAGFGRVEHEALVYTDAVDGSLDALHTNALHLAGPAYLRNTSLWHVLDEETRRRGLRALAADLRSGELQRRVEDHYRRAVVRGHQTVFVARP